MSCDVGHLLAAPSSTVEQLKKLGKEYFQSPT